MTVPGNLSSPLLATAAADAGAAAVATKSLRFNSGDSSSLTRTPSSASNRKTWTWAAWVKISKIDSTARLFQARDGSSGNQTFIQLRNNNKIYVAGNSDAFTVNTDALFRDPGAWGHLCVSFDTTQSTAADRIRIFWNGVQQDVSGTQPSQDYSTAQINSTLLHSIGNDPGTNGEFFNGYLADIYLIDGSRLEPTSFGAFDDNGVFQAIGYSGTYGTNGFHLLDFANESTVGHDSSGNNNDFTANNLASDEGTVYSIYSSGTASGTKTPDKAFDGSLSTFCEPNDDQTITFDFTSFSGGGIAVGSSLRIYLDKAGTPAAGHFTVNGTNLGGSIPSGDWLTIASVTSLQTITFFHDSGTSSVELYAVEVDGATLVDGSGADLDVLFDVPTNDTTNTDSGAGGEISGNYCTLNPLDQNGGTLSNGNLDYDLGSGTKFSSGTIAVKSGKWFWEAEAVSGVTSGSVGGRFAISQTPTETHGENGPFTLFWHATGGIRTAINGTITSRATGTNYADGDILGLALDADANIAYFYKNGSLAYTYDFSSLVAAGSQFLAPSCWNGSNGSPVWTYNFGQRAFAYSARTNHKCLVSTNLPTPTIADGSDYFDTKLYTGNGSSQSITGLEFSPDFVWIKSRTTNGLQHYLLDTVRGATKRLISNQTFAESTVSQSLTAFNSDGFSVGSEQSVNQSSDAFVAWSWDAGSSSASSNTDGTITSSVKVNQTAGFSIISYTGIGDGSTETVGHGLNAAPEFVMIKNRDSSANWAVYHKGAGAGGTLQLNSTVAKESTSMFDDQHPSSSVVYLKENSNRVNNPYDYIAYCWTPVAGYSAFGSYEGNGSTDGPFVHTGFRVAFLILKCHTATELWMMHDSTRDPDNVVSKLIQPHTSDAEIDSVTNYGVDFLSNGFKFRSSSNRNNGSGKSYVYIAFAENPFQANGGLAR